MKYKLKKDLKAGDIINTDLGEDICEEVKEVEVNRFLYEKPKKLDTYHYVDQFGSIHRESWVDWGLDEDEFRIGNCYSSYTLAKKARDKQLAKMELLRTNKGFVPDWGTRWQSKYFLYYINDSKQVSIESNIFFQADEIYFKSEEDAQNAIDTLGEDKIKLALGVD